MTTARQGSGGSASAPSFTLDLHNANAEHHDLEPLSFLQLPMQPPSAAVTVNSLGQAASSSSKAPRYKHVLPLQAINPRMDLVALLSRDIQAPTPMSSNNGSTSAAAASIPGLAPPPPGMSAARSQALMRMRMAARAKALAAAGLPPEHDAATQPGPGGSSSTTSAATPKVTRCPALRLSLWRMASVPGEEAARVWDVPIQVPDRFEDAPGDVKELEDLAVDSLSWRPDGRLLSLLVQIVRRNRSNGTKRRERFISLYAVQDGKNVRIVPIERTEGRGEDHAAGHQNEQSSSGSEWRNLPDVEYEAATGSAEHVISLLGPLPDIIQSHEDAEGKARQRQRLFQALRNPNKPKAAEDKKAEELIPSDPRGLGKHLLEYPRGFNAALLGKESSIGQSRSILLCWHSNALHLLLDGAIYLGKLQIPIEGSICSANIHQKIGAVSVCIKPAESRFRIVSVLSGIRAHSPSLNALLRLEALSTVSFHALTYCHDAVIAMRSTYTSLHADCIAPWNRRARLTAKRYATHLPSEILMLLSTEFANDTILSVLLGSDAMSENDLKKTRSNIAASFAQLEAIAGRLTSALQRLILVFEELSGCARWPERFGVFLGLEEAAQAQAKLTISALLNSVGTAAILVTRLSRRVHHEQDAWHQFYKWWIFERARQEALRDNKTQAEAIVAAGGDITYDIGLLTSFIQRGFESITVESLLGIVLDAKTRGNEVEDDDDEEEAEDERSRNNGDTRHPGSDNIDPFSLAAMKHIEEDQEQASYPWYKDSRLQKAITETIEALREPPKAGQLFKDVGRTAPSTADQVAAMDTDELHSGPVEGLAQRKADHKTFENLSLLPLVQSVLRLASPLFRNAFAKWTNHDGVGAREGENFGVSQAEIDGDLVSMSAASLYSAAEKPDGDTTPMKASHQTIGLQTCLSQARNQLRFAFLEAQPGGNANLVIGHTNLPGEKPQMPSQAPSHPITVRVGLGHAVIRRLSFFSFSELVLLSGPSDVANETTIITIGLDDILLSEHMTDKAMLQPLRLVRMNAAERGNLTQLALNRQKDVCATLSQDGRLVYWDMVATAHTPHQKDMGFPDVDDEMSNHT